MKENTYEYNEEIYRKIKEENKKKIKMEEIDVMELKKIRNRAKLITDTRIKKKITYKIWDALNTQKDTVKAVIESKGDYIGAKRKSRKFLSRCSRLF